MKATIRIKLGCLFAITAIASLVTAAQADTPAFTLGSVVQTQPTAFEGTRGWGFHPGLTTFAITQLGVFDDGGDGLVNSHQIGLWSPEGTLLASATIPAGTEAPLIDGYRYVPISPVLMPPCCTFDFVVAAQYAAGDADDLVRPLPAQFSSDVAGGAPIGRRGIGPGLPFPGQLPPPCEGCPGERFWEPNFQYTVIPEPSVWLLLSPAVFYLFIRHRKAGSQR